jgi:glycerol-3-phosphate dehydrogenase
MNRDLNKINNAEYDIIIIGGGMFGACAFWEAAHRGLSACLIEKGDFCEATSANHYKMVHGGIRYIQHGDLVRLRESSVERSAFLRIAPHLVTPLPILIPTFGHGMKGKEILRTGMMLYDTITADRNYKIFDSERKIPSCYSLSKDEVLNLFPGVKIDKLTGGAVFNDAQMYNPPRLVLSFIKSACNAGADAANYLQAENLLIKNNRCYGVRVKDRFTSDTFEVKGKIILNTTGPWTSNFLGKSGIKVEPVPSFSRDTAFVLNRPAITDMALATTLKTKDVDTMIDRGGRHVFIVPWIGRNKLMVGVWHIVWDKSEDKISVSDEEIEEFISEVNEAYPSLELSKDDVALVNTGLTLFGERTPGSKRMSFGKKSLLIDHHSADNIAGIISLIGVRATMGRGMAEKAINLIIKKLNKKVNSSRSKYIPLAGGDFQSFNLLLDRASKQWRDKIDESVLASLLHNYGSLYSEVLNTAGSGTDWNERIENSNVLKSEIIYTIKNEMALKLKDVLLRRTDLGTAGYPGKESILICADIMASALKWDENRKQKEIAEVEEFYSFRGSIKSYSSQYEYVE